MPNYAMIQNNEVTNVIVAETQEIAETATGVLCVEIPDGFGIGDTWDGFNFIKPTPTIIEGEVVPPAIEG